MLKGPKGIRGHIFRVFDLRADLASISLLHALDFFHPAIDYVFEKRLLHQRDLILVKP